MEERTAIVEARITPAATATGSLARKIAEFHGDWQAASTLLRRRIGRLRCGRLIDSIENVEN
jgi:hypothetical protein